MIIYEQIKWKSLVGILIALVLISQANGAVTLMGIFHDNMVLQRDMPVPVWGRAVAGEEISVSFAEQTRKTITGKDGKWILKLDPMPACKLSREMVIKGTNTLKIKNVVVGEVWVCSGQSNMEFRMGDTINYQKEKKNADFPLLRILNLPRNPQTFPYAKCHGGWNECSAKKLSKISAVAYHFGKELFQKLDIPIGLITTSYGGTGIEAWIPPVGFRSVQELKKLSNQVDAWDSSSEIGRKALKGHIKKTKEWMQHAEQAMVDKKTAPQAPLPPQPSLGYNVPTKLYNGMIHPLIPYAIRGVIWYQGEGNSGDGAYFYKMKALINGWRQLWNQGDFPFYFVQLPNYGKSNPNNPAGGDGGFTRIREEQLKCLGIPNTGMAVTIDIGGLGSHPHNKMDVGKRLALCALGKTYKKKLVYSGPILEKQQIEGDKIRLFFKHTGSGLMIGKKVGIEQVKEAPKGEGLSYLSLAGADKKWHWAKAAIDGKTLLVSNDQVKQPVAVRYHFTSNPAGTHLYNKEGLPASPFRTDNGK